MFYIWWIKYFKFIIVGVNSKCNLCFTILIYWWYRPLPLLGRIFPVLVLLFFKALKLTTQKHTSCVIYRTFKQYTQTEIPGLIPSACCHSKGWQNCKLFYILYLTCENIISSNSFSPWIKEVIFDFTYDSTEQYKQCLPTWDQCILILQCFGIKTKIYCLNSTERTKLFFVVYLMI